MKQGWEVLQFDKCLEKTNIPKKLPKKNFEKSGLYPVVSQEASFINGFYSDCSYLLKVKKPIVVFGDHTKVVKLVDFDFIVGADGVKILCPINALESKFFYYALKNIKVPSLGYARHSKLLKEQNIPIPPLEEQKQIVQILDHVFERIERAKALLEASKKAAKELFESALNDIFTKGGEGWEVKKLGEVCNIIMGQSPKGNTYNINGQGTILINGPCEFGGKEAFAKTKAVKFTTKPTKMCEVGDLILCVRGSTTGRMNIAGHKACIGRGVAAIRANENQFWVNHYINLQRNNIYALGEGATFPNVSSSILKKITIPISPLEEQKAIVEKCDILKEKTEKLEAYYSTKLNDLAELKQSLLQKAFAGALDLEKAKHVIANEVKQSIDTDCHAPTGLAMTGT